MSFVRSWGLKALSIVERALTLLGCFLLIVSGRVRLLEDEAIDQPGGFESLPVTNLGVQPIQNIACFR